MTTQQKIERVAAALARFGEDDESRKVIAEAVAQNPWFSSQSICEAVGALVDGMLCPESVEQWLAKYSLARTPRNVLIIMSGNLPAVGFADLLCVAASGHRAMVKPSSKDAPLMSYMVRLFAEYFDVAIYDGCERVDALLAMGSDSTAAALREKYADIPKLLRASRSSVAVLVGDETSEELDALCRDITMYDGRGCRNVSQLLVPEGYDFVCLAEAMARTEVSLRWMNVYRHQRALLGMSGAEFVDGRRVVILRSEEAPMNLATLHYSTEDAASWLAVHDNKIQCVVGRATHPRAVPFGRSQYPTLTDYPDGVDTMNFLQSI